MCEESSHDERPIYVGEGMVGVLLSLPVLMKPPGFNHGGATLWTIPNPSHTQMPHLLTP
jgi:hypothetical protein